ncbi:MAG TPA: transglutaminase-like domain-containing protein [Solirubrobacteraceae bacterium]|nr:transglutaminase-like domain-containing protein [Solirubrobacteraceae bacterium]
MELEPFAGLAGRPRPPLDELALALAAEFVPVDAPAALAGLDRLGEEIAVAAGRDGDPEIEAAAVRGVLGARHGFVGDREDYDHPDNSMLDRVLARRTGLPILLSVVYVEAARRAGIELSGVGLPGHYVVGHFGGMPPILLDPFAGGAVLEVPGSADVVPWTAHQTALRMLNNLVGSYQRRHDLTRAIRAAELRLELPLPEREVAAFEAQLHSIRALLN